MRVVVQRNNSPPGSQALTLVPEWPVEAMPIGTLYFLFITSPNAGQKLPPVVPSWTRVPGLVLAGSGYSAAEVERELGVPVLSTLPDDPRDALKQIHQRSSAHCTSAQL